MTTPQHGPPADDALLLELGEVLRQHAGPPPESIAAAKDLFGWRTMDAELAALTYDSLLEDEPASVRSVSTALRTLTFDADGLTLELEIEGAGEGRRLTGQVIPAKAGGTTLTVTAGGVSVFPDVDDFGRFVAPLPAATGEVILQLVRSGGTVSAVLIL